MTTIIRAVALCAALLLKLGLRRELSVEAGEDHHSVPGRRRHRHRRAAEDRKSTRLNSSHVRTSYAVCCLKKKHRDCVGIELDYRIDARAALVERGDAGNVVARELLRGQLAGGHFRFELGYGRLVVFRWNV